LIVESKTTRGQAVELTSDIVRDIAELARLELSEEEVALYANQLSQVFGYFQSLQELDTSHIAPTASVLPLKNVLRPDVPGEALNPEEVVANAPDALDNQFRVSAVLDEA
jgi:aspartyl-tRNA(Asn)/glutamyl-tRNA(Gln) amidotransferase subunit C